MTKPLWTEADEARANIVGQNGNTGEHYGEQWKFIKGSDKHYEVSSFDRVRSLDRRVKLSNRYCTFKGKLLKQQLNKNGYRTIRIKGKHHLVHRLVAFHYIPRPRRYNEVNHKNGDKTDNKICNLEWCTRSYNCEHNYRTLGRRRYYRGTHPGAKSVRAVNIQTNEQLFFNSVACAVDAGFDQSAIHKTLKGQWKQYRGYRWEYAN